MNVVYLHSHDTGRQLSPYGLNHETPNLQKLAERGILFRRAFSAAPTCSPSRAALLTGMVPHSTGMLGLAHRGFHLTDYTRHLAHYLGSQGYETILSGIQHEATHAEDLGYQRILGRLLESKRTEPAETDDLANAEKVARFIREKHNGPYFLSYGMFNTHRPFPLSRVKEQYLTPPLPLPNVPEVREDYSGFLTSVRVMDQCVGIIMDALQDSAQDHDTLVLYTTDHGPAFPKMKCSLYDSGIGVAMILKFPDKPGYPSGMATDALVSQIDVFPTICDVLQIPQPKWIQGQSLYPLLRGETTHVRDAVFAEVNYHAAYQPMRCIRTSRYKLIRSFLSQLPLANLDDSASKAFLLNHGYKEMFEGMTEELYDLYLDPGEMVNLANSRKHHDIRQELGVRLQRWMTVTDDPLLHGPVPKPPSAIVNRAECYSADDKVFE